MCGFGSYDSKGVWYRFAIGGGLMAHIIILAALVAAIVSAGGLSASAQQAGAAVNPVVIDMRAATGRSAASAALLRKANEQGQVRVIVGLTIALRPAESLSEIDAALQASRLRSAQNTLAARIGVPAASVTSFDEIPFVSMWVNAAQAARLVNDLGVVNIQEDVPGTAGLNVSAPYIKANTVWDQGFKASGFTVAVLDTGVDKNHPMLTGKVASEACYSTKNTAQGISSFCPGGATSSTASGSGMPCSGSLDPCWHGTHVAGIAVGRAVAHGSATLRGIAPYAKLIAIKVFSKQNNQVVTFSTDWVKGLERVYALRTKFKIAAVNMSLGFGEFTGPCDSQNAAATTIIRKLRDAGIAVLVASMNDSKDNATRSPACITHAIAVGATGRNNNTIAAFSNHAPWVRLMAPGVDIVSARATGTKGNACVDKGSGHCASSGTSMSTPHVAGAFAILRDVRTGFTVDDIAAALECTGTLTTRVGIAKPRIDVSKAKAYLLKPPSATLDFTFTSSASGWMQYSGQWQCCFSGFLHAPGGDGPGYKVAGVPVCNEGLTLSGDITRTGNVATEAQGILFKAQFANNTNLSGYAGLYDGAGHGIVRRFDNYNLATDTGKVVTLCSGSVNATGNHDAIKVVTRGGSHGFYVNNKLVCTAHDRAYGTGLVGIFGFFGNAGGNSLSIDRFIIDRVEKVASSSPNSGDLIVAGQPNGDVDQVPGPAVAGNIRPAPAKGLTH